MFDGKRNYHSFTSHLDELRKSFKLQKKEVDLNEAVMKVVVGYLGTIEMPKENQVKVTCGRHSF